MPLAKIPNGFERLPECVICGDSVRHYPHVTCSEPCWIIKTLESRRSRTRRCYQKHAAKRRADGLDYYYTNKSVLNRLANERSKLRRKIDLHFKIKCLLRVRLNTALGRRQKNGSAASDLGCSIEFFKDYIALKFTDGMTWENHGLWHLDHIRPLSKFDLTNRTEFLTAAHYTNYQPLWAVNNILKSNK